MKQSRGFTLLEIVVAFGIFAVLASMVSIAWVNTIKNNELAQEQLARLADIQLAFVILGRSVEQISNREVRDNYGDPLPAFMAQEGLDSAIEFTRTGRIPMSLPGNTLKRVGFGIDEEKLWYLTWPVLDRAQNTNPSKSLLLEKIEQMEFRYLDDNTVWHSQWPPSSQSQNQNQPMPRALEITLDTRDWGKLTRIFVLPEYE